MPPSSGQGLICPQAPQQSWQTWEGPGEPGALVQGGKGEGKICLEGAKDRAVNASEANPNSSLAISKNLPLNLPFPQDFVSIKDLKKESSQIVPKHSVVKHSSMWRKNKLCCLLASPFIKYSIHPIKKLEQDIKTFNRYGQEQ